MKVVYVTGNTYKAQYFTEMVGLDIEHRNLDVDEIQSTSQREVIEHKVKQAYNLAQCPVIVEDTRLIFNVLGALPGTFIKWFLQELGDKGLCKLLNGYNDRTAVAGATMAYYDGLKLEIFEKELAGTISSKPRGNSGFGWNKIFIPNGSDKTLGEMEDEEFKLWYAQVKPFAEMRKFLQARY